MAARAAASSRSATGPGGWSSIATSSARCSGASARVATRHRRRRLRDPASIAARGIVGQGRRRCGRRSDEAADPLRREVRVADDRRAVVADDARMASRRRSAARAWRNRISVFSSTSEADGVDLHLARAAGSARRRARGACGRARRCSGAGRDVQTSQCRSSSRAQDAVEVERPALGGVGPVLGRAERVVGDEELGRGRGRSAPRPARAGCTRAPPSPRSAARAPSMRAIAVLPISGGPVSDGEVVALEHASVRAVGARGHEDPRELARGRDVERRARARTASSSSGVEVADAEHGRHAPAHGGRASISSPRRSRSSQTSGLAGRSADEVHAVAERPLLVVRRRSSARRASGTAGSAPADPWRSRASGPSRRGRLPGALRCPRGRDQRRAAAALADQRRRQRLDRGDPPAVGMPVPEQPLEPVRGEQLVAQLLELQPAQLVEAVGRSLDRASVADVPSLSDGF